MCAVLSDVIDSQYSLGSYHEFRYGLRESGPFSRLSKCPIPFYFPLKIAPPLPFQLNTAMFASRNVSCSAKKSEKSNPTLNIGGRREKSKILWKIFFFFFKIYVENYQALMLLDQYKDSIQFQIDILRKWSHLRFH